MGALRGVMKRESVFTPTVVIMKSHIYVDQILDLHLIPFWDETCEAYR